MDNYGIKAQLFHVYTSYSTFIYVYFSVIDYSIQCHLCYIIHICGLWSRGCSVKIALIHRLPQVYSLSEKYHVQYIF